MTWNPRSHVRKLMNRTFTYFQSRNKPSLIHQYSNMTQRLSIHFVNFQLSLNSQKKPWIKKTNPNKEVCLGSPRSHVRILIYRTWQFLKRILVWKHHEGNEGLKKIRANEAWWWMLSMLRNHAYELFKVIILSIFSQIRVVWDKKLKKMKKQAWLFFKFGSPPQTSTSENNSNKQGPSELELSRKANKITPVEWWND